MQCQVCMIAGTEPEPITSTCNCDYHNRNPHTNEIEIDSSASIAREHTSSTATPFASSAPPLRSLNRQNAECEHIVLCWRGHSDMHTQMNVDLGPNIRDQAGEIAQVTVITSKPSRWGCREIDNHRPFGAQEWFTRESFGNSAVATH